MRPSVRPSVRSCVRARARAHVALRGCTQACICAHARVHVCTSACRLPVSAKLDSDTMDEILRMGFSRIPLYADGDRSNIR